MASTTGPMDLNGHHRTTLRKIFEHPTSHSIDWRDVVSLLNTVGLVQRHTDNKVAVTVGTETRFLDLPDHKDVDTDAIVELRHLLADAGYGVE
jgi:hypothetical protein